MFCPSCQDEFRPGFTRCARCNVELVAELSSVKPGSPVSIPVTLVRLADFCGFFSLAEARHARDRLRQHRIRSEIVVREPPEIDWEQPAEEEFWIRVDAARHPEAEVLLGDATVDATAEPDDSHFNCSECSQRVAAEETFCPKCGARFDD